MRFWSILGTELWLIRLPAVIIGILTLFLVWKLMGILAFSPQQKAFVSFLIAFCPGLIWISQDARAYGLLVFLYLLSIFFIFKKKWLGFFAANGLLLYTHITGPAFVVGSFAFAIAYNHKDWKRIIVLGFAVVISWIPWGLVYFNIHQTPQFINTFWLGKISLEGFFREFMLAFFGRQVNELPIVLVLLAIALSVILLGINTISHLDKRIYLFLVPFVVILVESIFWYNTLFYRTLITLIIPFTLVLGSLVGSRNWRLLSWVMVGLWILITGIGIIGWNPRLRGGNVDKAAQTIRDSWQEGDVIYYGTGTAALPFDYYLSDKPRFILNGVANSNLTPPTLHHFDFIALEEIQYKRAWIIFPMDTFIPQVQMNRLLNYVKGGELIQIINIFEIPDIRVYLVDTE
ncbi:MAG: hypothetical protein C0391_08370 [Anaerolinea sp.]|nr:hypothetical protein [Anaerolinea sp.]